MIHMGSNQLLRWMEQLQHFIKMFLVPGFLFDIQAIMTITFAKVTIK